MPDLPIQIVDEKNEPAGSATKQEAWRDGLIHRVVRMAIFDTKGRMLVQKRSDQKELFPGRWDNSAAGHVDVGETYEQAALRELEEELGVSGATLEKMGDYYVEVKDNWRIMKRFTRAYRITLKDPLPVFQLPEDEVASTAWMELDAVRSLVNNHPEQVTDGLEQIVERFFSLEHEA